MPAVSTHIRFGDALDLVGMDLPGEVRPGDMATVRYHWRLAQPLRQDYWAFLHVRGAKNARNQDQPIGGRDFGTSLWSSGEEVRQSVTFRFPPTRRPGAIPFTRASGSPGPASSSAPATDLPVVAPRGGDRQPHRRRSLSASLRAPGPRSTAA